MYKPEIHNYLNKSYTAVKGLIREYDIQKAGYNILKSKLSKEQLLTCNNFLLHNQKFEMNKYIGLILRENRNLNEYLMKRFIEIRKMFIERNNIEDRHIISVKKDSFILCDKIPKELNIEEVEFTLRDSFTSYFYLVGFEFYFNSKTNLLYIKGCNEDCQESHKDMIDMFKRVFKFYEKNDKENIVKEIIKFKKDYFNGTGNISIDNYREFNNENLFRTNVTYMGDYLYSDFYMKNYINIMYNLTVVNRLVTLLI